MFTNTRKNITYSLQPIKQRLTIYFNYHIYFTHSIFDLSNPLLSQLIAIGKHTKLAKIGVVIDGGLLEYQPKLIRQLTDYIQYYADTITLPVEPMIVPGGEAAKNDPQLLEKIHKLIDTAGLCRHSFILGIGGGSVLDLVGYAAATAHRGIRLIRIPTTVLAQNDSAVGVKNGINALGKKNFAGTFAPPYAVINDFDFLKTLDERDWRSGMAEAVKVGLIKDGDFFEFIQENATALASRNLEAMQQLIYRCAQLHLEHIANAGDPFEIGSSRPLDFGHWAAHKLEYLTNYSLRHGEAVAIGIALDSTYSYLLGMLSPLEWQSIIKTLLALGFNLFVPELIEEIDDLEHPRCLFRGLNEFREHLGGKLTIMLLENIGQGKEVNEVDIVLYRQSIGILQEFVESNSPIYSDYSVSQTNEVYPTCAIAHTPSGKGRVGEG